MHTATGFQIAFLVLACEFFSMLVTSFASAAISWPRESFEFLGQVTGFGIAALVLFGIGPLRRQCRVELGRRLPEGRGMELAIISLAKAAVPFAVVGAIVLWYVLVDESDRLSSRLYSVDPVKAWDWTLSPPGIARMIVLSWLVGPIIEELVFRGFLFRAWERQWGWIPSLLLTSACFGACHPSGFVSSFLGSVVYICVLRRTGTLRGSILVHMAYNVIVSWPILGHVLLKAPQTDPGTLSTWSVPLTCLVFVAMALPAYLWMSRVDVRAAAIR